MKFGKKNHFSANCTTEESKSYKENFEKDDLSKDAIRFFRRRKVDKLIFKKYEFSAFSTPDYSNSHSAEDLDKMGLSKADRRLQVCRELLETETNYINALQLLVKVCELLMICFSFKKITYFKF